jgi:hypothetical protein
MMTTEYLDLYTLCIKPFSAPMAAGGVAWIGLLGLSERVRWIAWLIAAWTFWFFGT